MSKRERNANRWAVGIGLLATALVCVAYLFGLLDWLELRALDLRIRYANSIPTSDELARIDIDDSSIETVGRWPWPRYKQACLVSIPAELGARAIVFDIELLDEEKSLQLAGREISAPELDADAHDEAPDLDERASDFEMREAIAKAENVYLAIHAEKQTVEDSVRFAAVVDALAAGREPRGFSDAAKQRARDLLKHATGDPVGRLFERAQMVAALARAHPASAAASQPAYVGLDFDTSPAELAEALHIDRDHAELLHSRSLIAAARRLLEAEIRRDASLLSLPPREMYARIAALVTADPPENRTPRTEALARAIGDVTALVALRRHAYVGDATLVAAAARFDAIRPILAMHAAVARRCGLVVFDPDADGVTRRLPILATVGDGYVYPQLAFSCAADLLGATQGRKADGIAYDAETRRLRVLDRVVQLDENGRALIPWVLDQDAATASERHVPAEALYQVFDRRQKIADNELRIRDTFERIYASDFFPEHDGYVNELRDLKARRRALRAAQAEVDPARAAALSGPVQAAEKAVVEHEQRMWAYLDGEKKRIASISAAQRDTGDEMRADTIDLIEQQVAQFVEPARRAIPQLQEDIRTTMERLRPRLGGKVCVVGYNATALADMTITPMGRRAPGAFAHYWLLNGFLTNRFISWATPAQNTLLTVLAGLLATLLSVGRSSRAMLFWIPGVAAAYVVVAGFVAFYFATFWIALVPPLIATAAASLAIAFHRYLFIERERRQLATALGQYTSKAIARQVAENPELCRRAESRDVTVMFTDLRGFTQISERIGAQRTQRVLNACLERCTEVLLRHEAMVNKFMGDGIFAFWNPVIIEQPDHARRACETAVDVQLAMAALAREQASGDPVFAELVTRIGVATGNAVVGPCGSEMKYDYTCIGDSVNVAARLESANKFFGTLMLVNEATRLAVGGEFAFRPIGGVRVKGKRQAVQVFELLGRTSEVSAEMLAEAAAFAEAVRRFQVRAWDDALHQFDALLNKRSDDLAAERYRAACLVLLSAPPGPDWLGAIELDEK